MARDLMIGEPEPLISIVIPTYNMEEHIAETLNSVIAQTFQNWEAIVVDDASTDRTAEIVQDLCLQDPRIRYIRLAENSNLPAVGRNRGIKEADGSYVAFLDHDDLWEPKKLERQISAMNSDPSIGMVHSHLWVVRNGNRFWGPLYLPAPKFSIANTTTLAKRNMIQCSSVLIRKSILDEVNGFEESPGLRAVEDYHLWYRVSQKTRITYVSEIHGTYRLDKSGTSSLENMQQRLKAVDESLGIQSFESQRSIRKKVVSQLASLPSAIYFVLIEGTKRKQNDRKPRTWVEKAS
jgi:teichuronic acid biosynthesis glycosyltransferase TuaG